MTRSFAAIVLSVAMFGQSVAPLMAQANAQGWQDRPGYPGYDQNRGYAGRITCESRKNRTERCNVRTEDRVVLISQNGRADCTQGRSWGYDRRQIWVSRNCRATFAYGYGGQWDNQRPPDRDKGPSTGAIIGGVAVAAGLLALLASQKKKAAPADTATSTPSTTPPSYPAGPPAQISADLSSLQAAARPSMQTCLFEASRQIGATGGTKLRYDRATKIEPGNGGWRFAVDLTATYPDGERPVPIYCRATPSQVVQLDFTS